MERFAIAKVKKKSSKKGITQNLCRLCGIDHVDKVPILETKPMDANFFLDAEPDLREKIFECVGIQVVKNDKMPQSVCQLCCDKINDFYEYRAMCAATNIQTRKLLGLPVVTTIKTGKIPKRQKLEQIETIDLDDCIFGVMGDEVKPELTTLDREQRKQKKKSSGAVGRPRKASVSEKLPKNVSAPPLLALKSPNKRELMREKARKQTEKKRKSGPYSATQPKKIKREEDNLCHICDDQFTSESQYVVHMQRMHVPYVSEHGCSSCGESFKTYDLSKSHHDWHTKHKLNYQCFGCWETLDKPTLFTKHISNCIVFTTDYTYVDDIFCQVCHLRFVTKNLYDWHDCFIHNNANCPSCQRFFAKKAALFKHLFKCDTKTFESNLQMAVPVPRSSGPKRLARAPCTNVKREPEAILDACVNDDYCSDDDRVMHDHFSQDDGDSSDDNDRSFEPSGAGFSFDSLKSTSTILDAARLTRECMERVLQVTLSNVATQPEFTRVYELALARKSRSTEATRKKKQKRLDNFGFPSKSAAETFGTPVRIKPEPVDYTEYTAFNTTTVHANAVVMIPPRNIKKEVEQPEYVAFDPVIARNIKQERSEKESHQSLRMKIRKRHGSLMVDTAAADDSTTTQSVEPEKIVYKKPALLGIKIKQERIERETTENYDECSENETYNYDSYAGLPVDTNLEEASTEVNDIQLPVIAVVSSAVDVPLPCLDESVEQTQSEASPSRAFSNFVPIKIKLERPCELELSMETENPHEATEPTNGAAAHVHDERSYPSIESAVQMPVDENVFDDRAPESSQTSNFDYQALAQAMVSDLISSESALVEATDDIIDNVESLMDCVSAVENVQNTEESQYEQMDLGNTIETTTELETQHNCEQNPTDEGIFLGETSNDENKSNENAHEKYRSDDECHNDTVIMDEGLNDLAITNDTCLSEALQNESKVNGEAAAIADVGHEADQIDELSARLEFVNEVAPLEPIFDSPNIIPEIASDELVEQMTDDKIQITLPEVIDEVAAVAEIAGIANIEEIAEVSVSADVNDVVDIAESLPQHIAMTTVDATAGAVDLDIHDQMVASRYIPTKSNDNSGIGDDLSNIPANNSETNDEKKRSNTENVLAAAECNLPNHQQSL